MAATNRPRHHSPEDRTRHEESARPERTVDTLEERVLGETKDQDRETPDEEDVGTEPA